jgi:hypothetical protein
MRTSRTRTAVLLSLAATFLFAACADDSPPTAPATGADAAQADGTQQARVDLRELFHRASPAVLALPQTVYADYDESRDKLVFGVENMGVSRGIQNAMERLGVAASDYEVKVTQPIRRMVSLQGYFDTKMGGIQIHFGNYLCTMGFNVLVNGELSFITNSHCTDHQGGVDGTVYYQPLSSVNSTVIATEVDDPKYTRGGQCPKGSKCRYSDASRALYSNDIPVTSAIAQPVSENTRVLDVSGTFDISAQDDQTTDFSGSQFDRIHKVGRTTGWTSGAVVATCADVRVSGSNITQLCQTLVDATGSYQIVGSGDSGSPVFTTSGGNATLIGILWGGSSDNREFVFSPLKNIVDELGSLDAVRADGMNSADGGGGGGGGDGGGGGGHCPVNGNKPGC